MPYAIMRSLIKNEDIEHADQHKSSFCWTQLIRVHYGQTSTLFQVTTPQRQRKANNLCFCESFILQLTKANELQHLQVVLSSEVLKLLKVKIFIFHIILKGLLSMNTLLLLKVNMSRIASKLLSLLMRNMGSKGH